MKPIDVAVLGAGTMGNGIAQVFAQRGHSVTLRDLNEDILKAALAKIEKSLAKLAEKGKIKPEDRDAALGHIKTVTDVDACAESALIVEAAVEDVEVKLGLFEQLDRLAPAETILASNTSSISITKLGAATSRPEKVIGMHFMNPVPLMKLVEVIRGQATSDDTTRTIMELASSLGKTPVEVNDFPGFVANRVLMPLINEAIYAVYEGVATPEAVDEVLKLGANHPMGPLALADLIGLDVCLAIMSVIHDGLGDSKYRPCPLLKRMVDAGWLGRKTGRGFHQY